ncbi:hypothetical protein ACEPAG_81 [Sanghuangporus baumii]
MRQGVPQTITELQLQNAIKYVKRVKARYKDDPETYQLFLDAIFSISGKDHNYYKVYRKIERLFKDAPDLLAEFKSYISAD